MRKKISAFLNFWIFLFKFWKAVKRLKDKIVIDINEHLRHNLALSNDTFQNALKTQLRKFNNIHNILAFYISVTLCPFFSLISLIFISLLFRLIKKKFYFFSSKNVECMIFSYASLYSIRFDACVVTFECEFLFAFQAKNKKKKVNHFAL